MSVRNGLNVVHRAPNDFHEDTIIEHGVWYDLVEDTIIEHGVWLNEAVIESVRREIMQTGEVRYEAAVILLETLDVLSPGLRDGLFLAALSKQGPGPVFGKVEVLLGPTGIEQVEHFLARVKRLEDLPEYKASVMGLLDEHLRLKASKIFDRIELDILGKRERYLALKQNPASHT